MPSFGKTDEAFSRNASRGRKYGRTYGRDRIYRTTVGSAGVQKEIININFNVLLKVDYKLIINFNVLQPLKT